MSLSNIVKTYELEPVLFNQQYCEWRVPADKIFLSSLRLSNFGLTTTGTIGSNAPLEYADNAGVFQIVQNLYLYHNNQVLCQIQGVDDWMAFKSYFYSNEDNKNKLPYVAKNNWGFEFVNNQIQVSDVGVQSTISSNSSQNQPALISLNKILSFLDNAPYLNTAVMPQLRVVIEFKSIDPKVFNFAPVIPSAVSKAGQAVIDCGSNAEALGFAVNQTVTGEGFAGTGWTGLNANIAVTAVAGNNVTINIDSSGYGDRTVMGGFVIKNFDNCTLQIKRPYLLLDELYTANLKDYPFIPIKYASIQMQQVQVPANSMNINQRLNAWNNKKLIRMLMINKSQEQKYGVCSYRSLGMYRENFQFWANGQQVVPNQGINTDALKQFYLQNSWITDNDVNKVINIPQGGSDARNLMNNPLLFVQNPAQWERNTNLAGFLSYGGLRIADAIDQENISDLNMVYTREVFPINPANNNVTPLAIQAFTMLIYGEVEQEVVVSNGEVMVIG